MKVFINCLTLLFLAYNLNAQSLLQSGPMLGYSDLRESAIWVQTTQPAEVSIEYWDLNNVSSVNQTNEVMTDESKANTALLIANKVEPGIKYGYRILINGNPIDLPYKTEFQTQAVWKWRTEPPEFSFATGSCTYINEEKYDRPGTPYGGEYEIFEAIHASNPDFMLWLGDNMYLREPDWNSWTGIVNRWTHSRSIKALQPLLASTHHYAIWDDHDYGPNNSDRGFWNKNATLKAFELFWANPSYGAGDMKGAITQFQWNDVDFILLDNRFYRSPNKLIADNKTILGEAQKQWLKDVLISSNSSYKFIVIGGQFLNDAGKFELHSSNLFNDERLEIIDFIYKHNIRNVVFLTGDRHHTELNIMEEPGKPRIIELTVSALTSSASFNEDENNSYRVEGTYTNKRNYGFVRFNGPFEERKMHIEIRDSQGELIWERDFTTE